MQEPPFYEKSEFIDFCKTKGSKRFNPEDPFACAITQFLKTKHPDVRNSCCTSLLGLPYGEAKFGQTIAYLKLESYEVERVLGCRTFSRIVKVLSGD